MTARRDSGAEGPAHERVRSIRSGLPGQLRRERLTTAALLYGPLGSLDDLRARVGRALPWRLGSARTARLVAIERSEVQIPDDILLQYDDARQLGVFSRFMIATPAYYFGAAGEPWLVAEVGGTERWAVIACWRDGGPSSPGSAGRR